MKVRRTMIKLNDLGTSKNRVSIGLLDIYFSYETPIAFDCPIRGMVVSDNIWSKTTGKFINELEPDKSRRIDNGTFSAALHCAIRDASKHLD